ncbi:NAD-dependent epimerase/dehydratase family protein [Kribbella sp. NBC_00709]|uniref:NAD-dependent epimerase/dehydratase family protein n=1 Tax=Kribbella sp. NBC_00709 TaxID=2975972 RepID=UPI002E2B0715|nr:NAD-dependent epimerase/dehydratase family protein [Kribbella sp. NBC_00709]
MTSLRVLFLGGTGIISSACSSRAVESGLELTVLNRGKTSTRPLAAEARQITADLDDPATLASIAREDFDVVVDWLAFTPEQVRARTDALRGHVGQYVFISSASAYQTPPARLPITESTPLRNPFWQYSRNKIACEDLLTGLYRDENYPVTIVRPSHTYDRTLVPFDGGWTIVERMRRGQPVVVHGDGTSLWTLTHHRDFARGLVPLLGHPRTIGDTFQITSDDVLTWDQIAHTLAAAAGTTAQIVHVPSDAIAAVHPGWGDGLLGDKTHSAVFDNTKLRQVVPDYVATIPFETGAREIVAWYDEDPSRHHIDSAIDEAMNTLISRYAQ